MKTWSDVTKEVKERRSLVRPNTKCGSGTNEKENQRD